MANLPRRVLNNTEDDLKRWKHINGEHNSPAPPCLRMKLSCGSPIGFISTIHCQENTFQDENYIYSCYNLDPIPALHAMYVLFFNHAHLSWIRVEMKVFVQNGLLIVVFIRLTTLNALFPTNVSLPIQWYCLHCHCRCHFFPFYFPSYAFMASFNLALYITCSNNIHHSLKHIFTDGNTGMAVIICKYTICCLQDQGVSHGSTH